MNPRDRRGAARFGSARRQRRGRSRLARVFDIALTLAILGLVALVAARLDHLSERAVEGVPVVNDGDSLTLAGERIRLVGIDAPEYDQSCERNGGAYPCGRQARAALVALVKRGPVECRGWQRDKYNRLLAECSAAGVNLNKAQVAAGWAVAYGDYGREEGEARAAGAGIWAGKFERPQDWRSRKGHGDEDPHDVFGKIRNVLREVFQPR
jgi:endonuclease YncB( thermonuclease family)